MRVPTLSELEELILSIPTSNQGSHKKIGIDDLAPEVLEMIGTGTAQPLSATNLAIPAIIEGNRKISVSDAGNAIVPIFRTLEVNLNTPNISPLFYKVVDDIAVSNNVFLVGEAGTGKTYLAEVVANSLGREYLTINSNQWTSPVEIIGGETIRGYKDGKLATAWEKGYVLIIDEMPKLEPNTAGIFNEALAKSDKEGAESRLTLPNGRTIEKHPNFAVIATGNTFGKRNDARYAANNVQDASLLDRFSSSIYKVPFDRELEINIVFTAVFFICDKIRDVILQEEANEIMTLRTMRQMNKIYHLEMQRLLGNVAAFKNGKTLRDSVKSYLDAIEPDLRETISEYIDFDTFFNQYKDVNLYKDDINDFVKGKKRKAPITANTNLK